MDGSANYLGEILKTNLEKFNVQVVTSEDPDEVRKARIDDMVLPSANITEQAKASFLENELENISELRNEFDKIALKRAEILVDAHERFRKVMGGKRFKVVEPVLPMDLMGVYIFLPDGGN